MDIDPEVQALLDELPRTKLPDELVKHGWGLSSMDDSWRSPVTPTAEPSPVFDHNCLQCGRPVTLMQQSGYYGDHIGRYLCDGGIVDEQWDSFHTIHTAEEHEAMKRDYAEATWTSPTSSYVYGRVNISGLGKFKQQYPSSNDPVVRKAKPKVDGPCSANKHAHKGGKNHQHICSQTEGHFGFHECKECRKLWK